LSSIGPTDVFTYLLFLVLCLTLRHVPGSPLFPYTTLFRSGRVDVFELRPRIGYASTALASRIPHSEAVLDTVLTAAYGVTGGEQDRKSTRLKTSHVSISYAVFCLKKKNKTKQQKYKIYQYK